MTSTRNATAYSSAMATSSPFLTHVIPRGVSLDGCTSVGDGQTSLTVNNRSDCGIRNPLEDRSKQIQQDPTGPPTMGGYGDFPCRTTPLGGCAKFNVTW